MNIWYNINCRAEGAGRRDGGGGEAPKLEGVRNGHYEEEVRGEEAAIWSCTFPQAGQGGKGGRHEECGEFGVEAEGKAASCIGIREVRQDGNFAGYKKSTPKGYVYMPGSRYLTKTSNLRLDSNYATAEQKKFVRGNRKAVNKAIEAAMRDGAVRRPGLNSRRMVDVDLSRGGKKFADQMKEEFFGRAAGQSSPRSFGKPHAGMRRRSRWSFAFGQDGHVR